MINYLYMKQLILLLLVAAFFSCSPDSQTIEQDTTDYTKKNEEDILSYLDRNNLTAEKTDSGLYYIINNQGSGEFPNANSEVNMDYKGYFFNGNTFDENTDFTYNLQGLIPGFSEGVQLLKEGGDITLLIPSALGYGSTGIGIIPPNSVILFDVKLNEIIN